MQQHYQNRLNMWRVVLKYLMTRSVIWQSHLPFKRAVEALQVAITKAEAAEQAQTNPSTGITQDKHLIEEKAIDLLLPVIKNAKAYALETENNTLYQQVNYSRKSLLRLSDSASLATMREVVGLLAPYTTALLEYGVQAGALERVAEAVDAYEAAMPSPRTAVVAHSVATESIPETMKEGNRSLKRMDNLAHNFEEAQAGFVAGYKSARKVLDLGTRHEEDDDDNGGPPLP